MSKKFLSEGCFLLALAFISTGPSEANTTNHAKQTKNALQQYISGAHKLRFSADSAYANIGSHLLQVDFVGHNLVEPQSVTPPSSHGKVMPLNRITYTNLWTGINLAYTGSSNSIYSTTYELSPGADAKNIRLHYNAPISLGKHNELIINLKKGSLTESAPVAWQIIKDKRVPVPVSFRVSGQEVGFVLGSYDPAYALTIDPTLVWKP